MRYKEGDMLGHQAPKGRRINEFNRIEIDGDLHYCWSHNFVFNVEEHEKLLHEGKPCIYTDRRFGIGGIGNSYKNCVLRWNRRQPFTLKAAMRQINRCKGIPVGTIVRISKDWYIPGAKHGNGYLFKVKKDNPVDIEYQISNPSYTNNFIGCKKSQELTEALRENGFLVSVRNENPDFLMGMIATAAQATGKGGVEVPNVGGEYAVAYGHDMIIGFSSHDNLFRGYTNGKENILISEREYFDKWSRCGEISKSKSVDEIMKSILE